MSLVNYEQLLERGCGCNAKNKVKCEQIKVMWKITEKLKRIYRVIIAMNETTFNVNNIKLH